MLYTIKTDNNYIFQLYTIYTMNIKPHKLNKYLQLYLTTTKQTIFYVKTTKTLFKISKIKNNGKMRILYKITKYFSNSKITKNGI